MSSRFTKPCNILVRCIRGNKSVVEGKIYRALYIEAGNYAFDLNEKKYTKPKFVAEYLPPFNGHYYHFYKGDFEFIEDLMLKQTLSEYQRDRGVV